MADFFKRISKRGKGKSTCEEGNIINQVSQELIAEESITERTHDESTNKLPEIEDNNRNRKVQMFNTYECFSKSSSGLLRDSNQDSIYAAIFKYHMAGNGFGAAIGIVADGMGGLSMGEVASSISIASVSAYMSAKLCEYAQQASDKGMTHSNVILGHISSAIKNANKLVLESGQKVGEGMGTTLTCAVIIDNIAYFGHVGDSRAYIIDKKSKTIEKVTRDHSLVGRLIEMGQLNDKEAKQHPRRNEIYRMLGLRNDVEVDTYYRIINSNSVILLMSDGLWEMVDDEDIFNQIINNNDMELSVEELVDKANKNGGQDNISLVVMIPAE